MPRETRAARTAAPRLSNPVPTARTQFTSPVASTTDPGLAAAGLDTLRGAISGFFGQGVSVMEAAKDAKRREDSADAQFAFEQRLHAAKLAQEDRKTKAKRDALEAGDYTPTGPDAGRAYQEVYNSLIGRRAFHEKTKPALQAIVRQHIPGSGNSLQAQLESALEEQAAGMPDDDLFQSEYLAQAYEFVKTNVEASAADDIEAVRQHSQRLLAADAADSFLAGTLSPEAFASLADDAQNILRKSDGETRAWLLTQFRTAATQGSAEDIERYAAMLHDPRYGSDGRAVSELFPEAAAQAEALALQDWDQSLTVRDREAEMALTAELTSGLPAVESLDDPQEAGLALGALTRRVMGFGHEHGRGAAYDSAMGQLNKTRAKVADRIRIQQALRSGQTERLTEKELKDNQFDLLQRSGALLRPDMDESQLAPIASQITLTALSGYRTHNAVDPKLANHLTSSLMSLDSPTLRVAAARTLYQMESQGRGPELVAEILATSPEAAAVYGTLKDAGAFLSRPSPDGKGGVVQGVPLERYLTNLRDNPDVIRNAREAPLRDLLGLEDDDGDPLDRLLNGSTGLFGRDRRNGVAHALREQLGGDYAVNIVPGSSLARHVEGQYRFLYAAAAAQGRTLDFDSATKQIASNLSGMVVPTDAQGRPLIDVTSFQTYSNPQGALPAGVIRVLADKLPAIREAGRILPAPIEEALFESGSVTLGLVDPTRKPGLADGESLIDTPGLAVAAYNPTTGLIETPLLDAWAALGTKETDAGPFGLRFGRGAGVGWADLTLPDESGFEAPVRFSPGQTAAIFGDSITVPESGDEFEAWAKRSAESFGIPGDIAVYEIDTAFGTQFQIAFRPRWSKTPKRSTSEQAALTNRNIQDDMLRREQARAVAEDRLPPSDGLTRPDGDPSRFSSPDDFMSDMTERQLLHMGREGFSPSRYDTMRHEAIAAEEGMSLLAYDDRDHRSIGYGFNLTSPGHKRVFMDSLGVGEDVYNDVVAGTRRITEEQARTLYSAAVEEAESIIDSRLDGVNLSQPQRIALVSLAYNSPSLIGPKLVSAVKAGDWQAAVEEILFNSGADSKGLKARRWREAMRFAHGSPSDVSASIPFITELSQGG